MSNVRNVLANLSSFLLCFLSFLALCSGVATSFPTLSIVIIFESRGTHCHGRQVALKCGVKPIVGFTEGKDRLRLGIKVNDSANLLDMDLYLFTLRPAMQIALRESAKSAT